MRPCCGPCRKAGSPPPRGRRAAPRRGRQRGRLLSGPAPPHHVRFPGKSACDRRASGGPCRSAPSRTFPTFPTEEVCQRAPAEAPALPSARLLFAARTVPVRREAGRITVEVGELAVHETVLIDMAEGG